MIKIGFIGAGKVGFSLGKYFKKKGLFVSGYYSRTNNSANEAAEFTHTEVFGSMEKIVHASDILFLTVSDSAISEIWETLKTMPIDDKIFFHCSGALSSEIFTDIEDLNAYGYSFHPMLSISDKKESYKDLESACFTIEGSAKYLNTVKEMVEEAGNKVYIIPPTGKVLYHTAAVFASNFTIALAQISIDLLKRSGFKDASVLYPLMVTNIENIIEDGTTMSLTGPVERGDVETISKHISSLEDDEKKIYALLTKKLISISEEKNPDINYDELKSMIGEIIQ